MKKLIIIVAALAVIAAAGAVIFLAQDRRPDADVVFICSDPLHDFDPQKSSWLVDFRILEGMFETLVTVELPEKKITPGVAEKWDVSEDGKTYTFHLREDAKWSNGDPVRAQDFVYAWRRLLMPDTGADYVEMAWQIKGAKAWWQARTDWLTAYAKDKAGQSLEAAKARWEQDLKSFDETVGVKAIDDRTLRVELDKPIVYFLELAAFASLGPVHAASIDAFKEGPNPTTGMVTWKTEWMQPGNVITNGAYILKKRRPKRDLLLVANPHYWNKAEMQNQSIHMEVIQNPQSAKIYYEKGLADWWPDVPSGDVMAADLVQASKAGKRNDVHSYNAAATYFYSYNCNPKLDDGSDNPLRDHRVRLALSLALDRKRIVEDVTRGGQKVADTYTPPIFPVYQPPSDAGHTFNPDRARQLLSDAGYPNGEGLRGLSLIFKPDAGHDKIAEFAVAEWKKHLGVDVAIRKMPGKQFGEALKTQKYTIARAGWFGDYRDPTTFLNKYLADGNNNDSKWANEQYDTLIAQAEQTLDRAKRAAILQQAETILLKEAPITPIYFYTQVQLYKPERVEGVYPNDWNYRQLHKIKVDLDTK